MYKSRTAEEYGSQDGSEEQTEEKSTTHETIVGEDGRERVITRTTVTKKTVATQRIVQGGTITKVTRSVIDVPNSEVEKFLEGGMERLAIEHDAKKSKTKTVQVLKDGKLVELRQEVPDASLSDSSDDEEGDGNKAGTIASKLKKFLKSSPTATKSRKESESEAKEAAAAIRDKESTPSTPSTLSAEDKEFEEECLKWHNHYRKKHGVPALKLSRELSDFAYAWVTELAARDLMEHRPCNVYGENIFMKWSSDAKFKISGRDPVENWYHEIMKHKFGEEPNSLDTGHFTQVVWKTSEELGVARAKSKSGKMIVVANYSPAGNVIGEFTENVPPIVASKK